MRWLTQIMPLLAVEPSTRRNHLGAWQRLEQLLAVYGVPSTDVFRSRVTDPIRFVSTNAILIFATDYVVVKRNKPSALKTELSNLKRYATTLGLAWPTDLPAPAGTRFQHVLTGATKALRKRFKKGKSQKVPLVISDILRIPTIFDMKELSHLEALSRLLVCNLFCLRNKSAIELLARHVSFKTTAGWRRYNRLDFGDFAFPCDTAGKLVIWSRLRLHSEKNNKEGGPRSVTLPPWVHDNMCAGSVLYHWLRQSLPHETDTLFAQFNNQVRQKRWTYNAALSQLKMYAGAIGLSTTDKGTHSLRRGGVSDYVHANKGVPFIISVTGHRSLAFMDYFFADEHVLAAFSTRRHLLRDPADDA
jgi:hypothetical protein